MSDFDSKVRNCLIKPKPDQDGQMFFGDDNGVRCNLVGYAIIPKAEYEELTAENERLRKLCASAGAALCNDAIAHAEILLAEALEATDDT